jgi:hypothetical protein
MDKFQRALARFAAIAALVFGALVAITVAIVTVLTGLVIGTLAMAAAWLGMRSRRAVPGARRPAGRPGPRDLTVIDVEMREVAPGERGGGEEPSSARRP